MWTSKQGIIVFVKWRKEILGEVKWIGLGIRLRLGSNGEDGGQSSDHLGGGQDAPSPPLSNVDLKLLMAILKTKKY